jgi:hypothetical protein
MFDALSIHQSCDSESYFRSIFVPLLVNANTDWILHQFSFFRHLDKSFSTMEGKRRPGLCEVRRISGLRRRSTQMLEKIKEVAGSSPTTHCPKGF